MPESNKIKLGSHYKINLQYKGVNIATCQNSKTSSVLALPLKQIVGRFVPQYLFP